jgi:hypothetical protein
LRRPFLEIVQRSWYFFRVGYSSYLSLAVGIVQFLFVASLKLQQIPAFANLHFFELAILFLVPSVLASVATGYIHTKKQMNTDAAIASLQNPFLYTLMPGKEARVGYPAMFLNLQVQRKLVVAFKLMTPDLEVQFDKMESLVKQLIAGGDVR